LCHAYPGQWRRETFGNELRATVLRAWRELQAIEREQAARAELPIAQVSAMLANINRDTTKQAQPWPVADFCFYRDRDNADSSSGIPPAAAAVALSLRHESRCPEILIAVWPAILEAADETTKPPPVRALHSDDGAVWVLAPQMIQGGCRGGLVAVRGAVAGPVLLRELDRPLLTHRLVLPLRHGYGWLEADLWLAAAN